MSIVVGSDNLTLLSDLYHKPLDVLLYNILSRDDNFLPGAIDKQILDLIDHGVLLYILPELIAPDEVYNLL